MARKQGHPSKDELLKEFQSLVADTEALLQSTADMAGEQADTLRSQIGDSLNRARSALKNSEQQLLERGQAAVAKTNEYVEGHPWQAVGLAGAVGLVVGLLLTRR